MRTTCLAQLSHGTKGGDDPPSPEEASEPFEARTLGRLMVAAVRLFSWSAFPLAMGGSLVGAVALIHRGVEPYFAIAAPLAVSFAFVIICEQLFPYRRSWLRSRGDVPVDAAFALTDFATERLIQLALAPGSALADRQPTAPTWREST